MGKESTQFKKGMSGNPKGKPPLPDDLKLLMRETSQAMKRDICEIYSMPLSELDQLESMDRSKISAGRAAIMSCLNNSYSSGDFKALNVMLDRVLGKIPEAPPVDGSQEQHDSTKDSIISQLVEHLVKDKK